MAGVVIIRSKLRKWHEWIEASAPVIQVGLFVVYVLSIFSLTTVGASLQLYLKGQLSWVPVAVGGLFIFAGTAYVEYMRRNKKVHYTVRHKTLTYQYLSQTHMKLCRKYKIEVIDKQLVKITDRYRWTGHGKIELELLSPASNDAWIENRLDREIWSFYDVVFKEARKRGDQIELEVEFDMTDQAATAQPFLSTTIDEPTDEIVLRVILPEDLRPRKAIGEICRHYTANEPLEIIELPVDKFTGEIRWEIRKPSLGFKYVIHFPSEQVIVGVSSDSIEVPEQAPQ